MMNPLFQDTGFCRSHHGYLAPKLSANIAFSPRSRTRNKHIIFRKRLNFREPCRCAAESDTDVESAGRIDGSPAAEEQKRLANQKVDRELSKIATKAATTFAPRASVASKNPAYKGSLLYTIFEIQAWLFLVIGGLLSFNIIFPSDEPNIARLLGMWSIWMFTIPALRARDCSAAEKEALNYLFLLVPVINVSLPLIWKSFPFIYSADIVALAALYAWKVGLPSGEKEAS